MNQPVTPPLAPAAPGILASIRTPAAARAVLAVLLAPLIALLDQSLDLLLGRLETLLAQFKAATLPAPAQPISARPAAPNTPLADAVRATPDWHCTPSWLTDLINLASQDTGASAPRRRAPRRPAAAHPPTLLPVSTLRSHPALRSQPDRPAERMRPLSPGNRIGLSIQASSTIG